MTLGKVLIKEVLKNIQQGAIWDFLKVRVSRKKRIELLVFTKNDNLPKSEQIQAKLNWAILKIENFQLSNWNYEVSLW